LPDGEDEKVLPLWDHFAELTSRLRLWITTFIVATMVFLVLPADLSFLRNPLGLYRPLIATILVSVRNRLLPSNVQLIAGTFTAPIFLYLIASAVLGFAVSIPVLSFQVYKFVNPALREPERKSAYPFAIGFSILFSIGAAFGFFLLLPLVITGSLFFFTYTGAAPIVRIDDFYNLFFTTVASALSFTLPLLFVLSVKYKVLATSTLTRRRKYLWIGVYIFTGLITPEGNPVSDIVLFIPIILLIEGSLRLAKRYDRNQTGSEKESENVILRCSFCNGPIDSGGVFCGRCGRSRI
jgi:sec-independent protein translocase protein TatC